MTICEATKVQNSLCLSTLRGSLTELIQVPCLTFEFLSKVPRDEVRSLSKALHIVQLRGDCERKVNQSWENAETDPKIHPWKPGSNRQPKTKIGGPKFSTTILDARMQARNMLPVREVQKYATPWFSSVSMKQVFVAVFQALPNR